MYERKEVIDPGDAVRDLPNVNVLDANGDPIPRPAAQNNNPMEIENTPWMNKRIYRDSAYACFASMYSQLQPDMHHQLKTSQVEAGMRKYTDHDIRYDYRAGKQGAFKAMEKLVSDGYVFKIKSRGEIPAG